jgi:hypothetical protein
VSAITKEDLKQLGHLALEYGKAKATYAQAIERAHHETVAPSRLTAYDSAEQNAWGRYRDLHFELLKRIEGEEFDEVVAGVERPTICTLEELDALPLNTAVLDADESAFQKYATRTWEGLGRTWDSGQISLPVTVIWAPEES